MPFLASAEYVQVLAISARPSPTIPVRAPELVSTPRCALPSSIVQHSPTMYVLSVTVHCHRPAMSSQARPPLVRTIVCRWVRPISAHCPMAVPTLHFLSPAVLYPRCIHLSAAAHPRNPNSHLCVSPRQVQAWMSNVHHVTLATTRRHGSKPVTCYFP